MVVFVKNKHGEALMPCSERKARLLLRDKKAKIGFISGFSGKTQCYVKNIFGDYVTISPKYKMVGLKKLNRLAHNNNWIQQRTPAYAG